MHCFNDTFSNLAYFYMKAKKENSKPCNIPSTQVHTLLEFLTVQPHLHKRIKVSQKSHFFSAIKATQPYIVTYQ